MSGSPAQPALAQEAARSANPLLTYLLRLADDHLIVAQRLGALVSHMPDLEEDIAVANLGLDHLGAARNLYGYASTVDPAGRDEDAFAMLRSEREFLNAVLVEQPNGDFANTVVRQWFLDSYQLPLYEALSSSSSPELAAIAAKTVKEVRYHLDYSTNWIVTLGNGTGESHARTQAAVDNLWRYTGDLFATDEVEATLGHGESASHPGVAADPAEFRPRFDASVAEVAAAANLTVPSDPYQRIGGRTGFHTEHLGHLLPEMQGLYRAHPGAEW